MSVALGDERLNRRYWKLVQAHMNHTQATWRFLNNERVMPQELVKPLRAFPQGIIV